MKKLKLFLVIVSVLVVMAPAYSVAQNADAASASEIPTTAPLQDQAGSQTGQETGQETVQQAAPAPVAPVAAPVPEAKPVPAIVIRISPLQRLMNKVYELVTGKKIDGVEPSATLLAPFADPGTKAYSGEHIYSRLRTNTTPLDLPHRSAADLSEWLMQALAETLSFTSDNYDDHIKLMTNGFSPEGVSQFNTWVTSSGIFNALHSNGLQLNGFVSEDPFLLNEGTVGGRYRWLFEVPVIISFVPRGTTNLAKQEGINSRKLLITLQLGRYADSVLPDAVKVESWSVQDNTRKN